MAFVESKTPYELLVRWNKDGTVSGAHVQFLESLTKDGALIYERVGEAIPVSMSGEAGFPLADILSDVQISALRTTEQAIASSNAKAKQIEILKRENSVNAEMLVAATAELDTLKAEKEKS